MNLPDPAAFLRNVVTSPSYWSAGILWSVLADAQATGGSYPTRATLSERTAGPMHVHHNPDEVFYILEGRAVFQLGETRQEGGPGDLISIPRGTPHGFESLTDELRVLNWYTPVGFERLIVETGIPTTTLTLPPRFLPEPDPAQTERIISEIGMSLC